MGVTDSVESPGVAGVRNITCVKGKIESRKNTMSVVFVTKLNNLKTATRFTAPLDLGQYFLLAPIRE